jgi:hypothetical protein
MLTTTSWWRRRWRGIAVHLAASWWRTRIKMLTPHVVALWRHPLLLLLLLHIVPLIVSQTGLLFELVHVLPTQSIVDASGGRLHAGVWKS